MPKFKYKKIFSDKILKRIISDREKRHMTTHEELAKMLRVNKCTIPAWVKLYPEFAKAESERFK